jgi:hypothetical protein
VKICPACGQARLWAEFTPNEHCGSPDVPSDYCALCQERLAAVASRDLVLYFAARYGLGEPVAA